MTHTPSTAGESQPRPSSARTLGRIAWRWSWLLLALGGGAAWWVQAQQARPSEAPAAPGAAAPGASAASAPGRPGGRRFGGANRVQPVSVAGVRRQDIRVTVSAIGTIAAANTAVVKPKIDGELVAIHYAEGQQVKAGALLAEIDPRAWKIALAQAEGQLARDQALWQNAKLDLARFQELLAKDGIAKQQLDTQDALVRQLQGTVQSDQAQVDNARLQLSYTRVVAPISGRVGLKQVDLGNIVHANDPGGLLTIAQTDPVHVVFAVPDIHLPQILSQLSARQRLSVEAWDRDQRHRLAVGQVASTDNAIDVATGTIKLKATFDNRGGALFPNQFVNVRLQLNTLEGALAVPSAALLRNNEGSYVYRVNDDKTVSVRTVQAGASDGDWVSVRGALQPGDQVVIDGTDRLRDGSEVAVVQPAADGPERRGGGEGSRRRRAGGGG